MIRKGAQKVAVKISPKHRRWRRLLRSLTMDPHRMNDSVPEPTARDFIICGAPRSGTSLLAAVLYQPPRVVTVMEPWDGMRLPPADLFASVREEIIRTGWLHKGRLDVEALRSRGEVRWGRDGEFPHPVAASQNFLLGIKWPAFYRYLEFLPHTKFLVCLRHPVEVINSYSHQGGSLRRGLEYDIRFNKKMNQSLLSTTEQDHVRRVLLYDYANLRLAPHLDRPNVFAVRYERWFEDRKRLLHEIGAFLGTDLGPGMAVIRRPRPADLSASELEVIERHCRSAAILGYDLSQADRVASGARIGH